MSSPFIERMRGRNEVLQQISKQSKESDWTRNLVKDEYGNPDISLCKNCWCMTHTLVGNICGKCKRPKHIIDVIGDENIGGESRRRNG